MAQLIVRNLEQSVKTRLQRRARRHGRSMEEEAREILRDALSGEQTVSGGLGSEIAALFSGVGLDSDIVELRGYDVQPASFER